MVTYTIAVAVVVVVLYASFRVLAAGQTAGTEDSGSVLERIHGVIGERADALAAALRAGSPAQSHGDGDPLVETATAARKVVAGCQQRLAALQPREVNDEAPSAWALLTAAADDYGWACRIIEAGTYRDNPGMQQAVDALVTHGEACLVAARSLLEPAPSRN